MARIAHARCKYFCLGSLYAALTPPQRDHLHRPGRHAQRIALIQHVVIRCNQPAQNVDRPATAPRAAGARGEKVSQPDLAGVSSHPSSSGSWLHYGWNFNKPLYETFSILHAMCVPSANVKRRSKTAAKNST